MTYGYFSQLRQALGAPECERVRGTNIGRRARLAKQFHVKRAESPHGVESRAASFYWDDDGGRHAATPSASRLKEQNHRARLFASPQAPVTHARISLEPSDWSANGTEQESAGSGSAPGGKGRPTHFPGPGTRARRRPAPFGQRVGCRSPYHCPRLGGVEAVGLRESHGPYPLGNEAYRPRTRDETEGFRT